MSVSIWSEQAPAEIIISIKPRFAELILDGRKTVELRRRSVRVPANSRVWIYSTLPAGRVVGTVRVERIASGKPKSLWAAYGAELGISRGEFEQYFDGCALACAIELTRPARLGREVCLSEIRKELGGYQPPQFFNRLGQSHPLLRVLKRAATN